MQEVAEKKIENLILTAQKSETTEPVYLLVMSSSNILNAIALTAAQLDSAEVIAGSSPVLPPEGAGGTFPKSMGEIAR